VKYSCQIKSEDRDSGIIKSSNHAKDRAGNTYIMLIDVEKDCIVHLIK
jgi:hypothetical protein